MDLYRSPDWVVIYNSSGVDGLTARNLGLTSSRPLFNRDQVTPASVDLIASVYETPYIVDGSEGSAASILTELFTTCKSSYSHVAPASYDLYRPSQEPAKTISGENGSVPRDALR